MPIRKSARIEARKTAISRSRTNSTSRKATATTRKSPRRQADRTGRTRKAPIKIRTEATKMKPSDMLIIPLTRLSGHTMAAVSGYGGESSTNDPSAVQFQEEPYGIFIILGK